MDINEHMILLPYTIGSILVVKKNYTSDDNAPDIFFVKLSEILLDQKYTCVEKKDNTDLFGYEPILRVIDKHFMNHEGEYVSHLLETEFILGAINEIEDLDIISSLSLIGDYKKFNFKENDNG